jgi:hypothetical protein
VNNAPADSAAVYRLAPGLVVRCLGAALVVLAFLVLAASLVTAVAGWGFAPVGALAVLGLLAVAAGTVWLTRRAYVVRLDTQGYEVRLLRGAGVRRARWADVAEASTGEVRGVSCVVLALRDGRTTTVPMAALAADRDEFVTTLRERLRQAR